MAHFCLLQIKNKVMQRYFSVLKDSYLWKSKKRAILRAATKKTKR
jgi:hypothetical protein